jgi:hypothetical protein
MHRQTTILGLLACTAAHDLRGRRSVVNLDGSGVRNLSRSRSNDWATSWQPPR